MTEQLNRPEPKGTPAPLIRNENGALLRNPEWAAFADKANRKASYDFSISREDKRKEAVVRERVIFQQ